MSVVERLQAAGVRRSGSTRAGFRYRNANGSRFSKTERQRIEVLAIPPAWTEVCISPSAAAPVQAVGKDRAGRWQYLYAEKQVRLREARKRKHLLAFLSALPGLRERVASHLRGDELTRERVLAAMVRLLLRGFMRAGSQVYARDNGTFGLSTLRPRHVRVRGRRVTLSYRGKGKKFHVSEIADAGAAAVVAQLLRAPGAQVFRHRGVDGEWADVRRSHVNDYLREITGARFTAKDFRTWAGTLLGACALARQGYPSPVSARSLRQRVNQAMRETAAILGNTPAVCRASYVCPDVLLAFEKGRLFPKPPSLEMLVRGSPRLLSSAERRLSRLILNGNGARHAA
jgi:DNA topoisomerase-1